MQALSRQSILLAALWLAVVPAYGDDIVAVALGEELARAELATVAGDEAARVARLLNWLIARLTRDYVSRRGLRATPDETAELAEYDREFGRRDRAQRARKLEELDERLAGGTLAPERREWLEEFRRVLARMARREAAGEEVRGGAEPTAVNYAPWVEYWKAIRLLHEEYGGAVAATEGGPSPHGAWAALIADYERSGQVTFFDASLRARLFRLLEPPPAMTVPPDQVDFTPYWKRPIPPSYFPD